MVTTCQSQCFLLRIQVFSTGSTKNSEQKATISKNYQCPTLALHSLYTYTFFKVYFTVCSVSYKLSLVIFSLKLIEESDFLSSAIAFSPRGSLLLMGGHSTEQFCTDAALTSMFSFKFSTGMSEPPCVVRDRAPIRPLMLPLSFQENGFLFKLSICKRVSRSGSHSQHKHLRLTQAWTLSCPASIC